MAFDMAKKGGTAVVVGISPWGTKAPIDPVALVRDEKALQGCYYGSARLSADMPKFINMYLSGKLPLDDLLTRNYSLDQINEAYDDLERGEVGRGVITRF